MYLLFYGNFCFMSTARLDKQKGLEIHSGTELFYYRSKHFKSQLQLRLIALHMIM
jgi:hypothetical protein